MPRIAVIPGDGIGVDVIAEGAKVLRRIAEISGIDIKLDFFPYGADHFLKTGETFPQDAARSFSENYDAIYLGALGDPRVPSNQHAADILFGLRFGMDLYVNYRPVKLLDARLTPLKDKTEKDVDFVIFRENTEGLYAMMGGNFKKGTPDEIAIQEDVNTYKGVHRIIDYAFQFARKNGHKKVTMTDKANALTYGHGLWQRVFKEVQANYPEIEPEHMYVDALVMQMVKKPEQFQVIVTCNMFGDIITDLGAQLQGGLGMAASGNIRPGATSMFEPVHGSAPKYAGKNIANPFGAVLTAAMMLEHISYAAEAALIEKAVLDAIVNDKTPQELGGNLGTREVGDYLCEALGKLA